MARIERVGYPLNYNADSSLGQHFLFLLTKSQLFCTRAEAGTFCPQLLASGYIASGWLPNDDLAGITNVRCSKLAPRRS